jgi:hypothetical protein
VARRMRRGEGEKRESGKEWIDPEVDPISNP